MLPWGPRYSVGRWELSDEFMAEHTKSRLETVYWHWLPLPSPDWMLMDKCIFSGWLISHKERCNIYYDHDSVTNRGPHVSSTCRMMSQFQTFAFLHLIPIIQFSSAAEQTELRCSNQGWGEAFEYLIFMIFRNLWRYPACSDTRASLQWKILYKPSEVKSLVTSTSWPPDDCAVLLVRIIPGMETSKI